MDTKLFFGDATAFETPMLAVFAVDVASGKKEEPRVALLTSPGIAEDAARELLESGEFKATLGEVAVLHAPAGLKAQRLVLIGLGKLKDFSPDRIRKGAGTAVRAAKPRSVRSVTIAFPDTATLSDGSSEGVPAALRVRAIVEGAELAQMDWDTYRSDRKDRSVDALTLVVPDTDAVGRPAVQRGFDEGVIVAAAQNFARSLV